MDGHESEEENLQKRYRSRNFTKYEKEVFYSVFSQYVSIIGDKNSSAYTIREAWDKLVVEYNAQQNVYPRTRRQLQVLWRDEKFRAKKKGQKVKERSTPKLNLECDGESSTSTCEPMPSPPKPPPTEGERHPSSLLTPLLTVIKREHEAYTAGEITPVLPLAPYPPPVQETEPCSTLVSKSRQKKVHGKVIKQEDTFSRSPSPERYGTAMDRVLPLPVEAQLHSGSSSPAVKHKYDIATSDEDDNCYWPSSNHRRKIRKNCNKMENGSTTEKSLTTNRREREIHKLRLQQLRQEGSLRMRVLEAELTLRQQQQHMEQQEHNLKMEILREKLKRMREGKPVGD